MAEQLQTPPQPPENPFPPEELRQFDRDDSEAGAAIGKMLSLFFLYTVVVMIISSVATYLWITNPAVQ